MDNTQWMHTPAEKWIDDADDLFRYAHVYIYIYSFSVCFSITEQRNCL